MSPSFPRPRMITVIGWGFIAIGCVTILKDIVPLILPGRAQALAELKAVWFTDLLPAWTIRALAVVAGVGVLRGFNWARWLLVVWMGFHVGLSARGQLPDLIVHGALSVLVVYFLFRPRAAQYFKPRQALPA